MRLDSSRVTAGPTRRQVEGGNEVVAVPRHYIALLWMLILVVPAGGQQVAERTVSDVPPATIALEQFRPRSMLKVPQHPRPHARFPVVDVHTHFHVRFHGSTEQRDAFVQVMDRNRIAVCACMDGLLPDGFAEQRHFLWQQYRDRFVIFVGLDWQGSGQADQPATWACNQTDFVRVSVAQLEEAAAQGASGLKIFKQFGLGYRQADGKLLRIDDPRWDPIWQACGRLGLPVLIHTGDPAAFFQPIDATNERWEELHRRPDWSFYGRDYPSRDELLAARNRVVQRHPQTIFIGAHMANNAEDLAQVGQWLDRYPNLFVEIASRISELGRQPYTARAFLTRYADRVLFGTDGPWPEPRLQLYWRFLETWDEYFPYSEKEFPPQGFWQIYGVGLEDDTLQRIYWRNAARLVPGVAERLEAFRQR
jgi:predicted TIM-barrel fold metal-dependent hydrolase